MTERSSDPPNKPSIVGYNYLIEFVGEALIGIRKEIVFHQPAPIRSNSSCFFSLTFQLPRALAHAAHRVCATFQWRRFCSYCLLTLAPQIGRAPCMARVCHYVKISVSAVFFKNTRPYTI